MIDLKELEENFKNLFEQETEESFNEWFVDKQKREALAQLQHKYLGGFQKSFDDDIVYVRPPIGFAKPEKATTGNIYLAMAA